VSQLLDATWQDFGIKKYLILWPERKRKNMVDFNNGT